MRERGFVQVYSVLLQSEKSYLLEPGRTITGFDG